MTLPLSGIRRVGSTLSASTVTGPAGILTHKDHSGKVLGSKQIYSSREVIIGRDRSRCQYVLNDPYISKRHLRIYTVVYEDDEPSGVENLVYAEDLSLNGTYWNGSFIGKGNGGFLLSDQDTLRLSRRTYLVFTAMPSSRTPETFDYIQETEMARFSKDYTLSDRLLGSGAFGKVFMAIEQTNRYQVACKVVDLRVLVPGAQSKFGRADQPVAAEDIDNRAQVRKLKAWAIQQKRKDALERQLSKYYREVDILASISHPNIIGIEKVYITDNTMYIMQDIVTAGDLFSYIESKNGKLLEVEAAVIVRQILMALSFLHSKNIVHRDIKPDNVLMTSLAAGCRVILTDFGAARRIENRLHRMSSIIGTHEYAAPEILGYLKSNVEPERPGYTRSVDMWAVGCVTVVLLTGGLAFCDPNTNTYSERLARDCNLDFLRNSKEWQVVRQRPKEFVEKLLVLEEEARLTAEGALQHSWFYNEVHKNDFEDLYQRTVKHWRPQIPRSNIVEFQDSVTIKQLKCSKAFLRPPRRSMRRVQSPIEPPYKPFPRQMHQGLWPLRSPNRGLSAEVLSSIETSSPTSAARLRIRADSVSPNHQPPSLSPTATRTTTEPRRGARAVSEPLPIRKSFEPQAESSSQYSEDFLEPATPSAHKTRQGGHQKSREDVATVRPPAPKLRKVLPIEHSNTLLHVTTFSNISPNTSSVVERVARASLNEPAAGVSLGQPATSSPLREVAKPTEDPLTVQSDGVPDSNSFSGTPQSNSGLKGRPPMSLINTKLKKRRGSSVFDLAEDTDSDEQVRDSKARRRSIFDLAGDNRENRPRLPRTPLVHRPSAPSAASIKPHHQSTNLYLPR
ncbi:CAMK protein kinase [Cladophialophora yegresii CBS 114405]|uniref:CAMK protein kinase n=1 Tax=Cladophialophora yegresii CBS 114405 TaxID=1182544 RepID=W9W3V5_9EURO|nr:CAMK protein kinase [Cladophialophora yegresii CBS 114405]EXJ62638.1 CAMK protein kinase [Cladophialophora yegresii CBS 114405]